MILSASRRTDIPRYHMEWLLGRLAEGYALTRNPMNHRQISRIPLTPDVVDCIAFWTKNPAPMLPLLGRLAPIPFFVQFTLNAYGPDVESGLPPKSELVETFKALAAAIGPQRIIWRYSPVLLNETYTARHHLHRFAQLAKKLQGHTSLCRLSFIEVYPKIAPRMRAMGVAPVPAAQMAALARQFAEIGRAYGITLGACGNLNLAAAGLRPLGCIDAGYVAQITGCAVPGVKDTGQRGDCYCCPSVDIGSYNTCQNGCAYCYANHSAASIARKAALYNPAAPMLCDEPGPNDVITTRNVPRYQNGQLRMY